MRAGNRLMCMSPMGLISLTVTGRCVLALPRGVAGLRWPILVLCGNPGVLPARLTGSERSFAAASWSPW